MRQNCRIWRRKPEWESEDYDAGGVGWEKAASVYLIFAITSGVRVCNQMALSGVIKHFNLVSGWGWAISRLGLMSPE